ncbi:hypothetical protein ACWGDE_30395 [Streptomyces sp. NPDC054956]
MGTLRGPAVHDRDVPDSGDRFGLDRARTGRAWYQLSVLRVWWRSDATACSSAEVYGACGVTSRAPRERGVVEAPLYSAEDVALLPLVRPTVDWRQVYRTGPGRRSLLATLAPVAPGEDTASLADAGRIAGVGRAAVVGLSVTLSTVLPAARMQRASLSARCRGYG